MLRFMPAATRFTSLLFVCKVKSRNMAADRSSADAPLPQNPRKRGSLLMPVEIWRKTEKKYTSGLLDGDHDNFGPFCSCVKCKSLTAKRGDREGANGYWDKILALDPRPRTGGLTIEAVLGSSRCRPLPKVWSVAGGIRPDVAEIRAVTAIPNVTCGQGAPFIQLPWAREPRHFRRVQSGEGSMEMRETPDIAAESSSKDEVRENPFIHQRVSHSRYARHSVE